MGNGSPALHIRLAGAAVLLTALTLAFTAPARAETTLPGALSSAPVTAAVEAAAAPVVDAVAPVAATKAEAASPVVAIVTTTAAAAPTHAAAVLPAVPAAKQVATLIPAAIHVSVPRVARPLVSEASLSATTQLAPRQPLRHPDRSRVTLRSAIASPTHHAVATARPTKLGGAVAGMERRLGTHERGTRTPSATPNAPVPSRSNDTSIGTGLGTASTGGGSAQFVAISPRSFAPARHDALFRVPGVTARPHSHHFLLELERPG
jgi:hypothetical protein